MTFTVFYISDNPDAMICSYKAFKQLGTEVLGLLMYPDIYCPDTSLYVVNLDEIQKVNNYFHIQVPDIMP